MSVGRQPDGRLRTFNSLRELVIEANVCDLGVRVQCYSFPVVLLRKFDDPVVRCEKRGTDRTRENGPTYQRPLGS